MTQCGHIITIKEAAKIDGVPTSLLHGGKYVLVSKDCRLNKAKEYSKYLFVKKEVCEECRKKEEENDLLKRKDNGKG